MSESERIETELVLEGDLPLNWQRLETPMPEAKIIHVNEAALTVLQAALTWDEASFVQEHADELSVISHELARMDIKLSLLLELVGELLEHNGLIPPKVPVKLGSRHISWTTHEPPATSGRICVSVCLIPGVPKAVDLLAVANSVEAVPNGFRVRAELVDLTSPVQEAIEKLVFRHHRRIVARARRYRQSS